MTIARKWVLGGCAALLAVSCAKTNDPEDLGTNTNWMKTCTSSSQCDGDEQCLCGVCTTSCTEDAECDAVNTATRCEEIEAAACGDVSVSAACLQGCDSDADCTALEDGRCVEGLCVPEGGDSVVPDANVPDGNVPDADVPDGSAQPMDGSVVTGEPYALRRDGSSVPITDIYLTCTESSDCVLSLQGCGGCCPEVAVRKDLWETYQTKLDEACQDLPPRPLCDCKEPIVYPVCRENRCTTVSIEDDCYSPYENLELAYVSGARGCSCEEVSVGASICVGPAALFCDDGNAGRRWISGEDGPCGEPTPDPSCEDGEVLPTPEACLAAFPSCYMLPSGEFCGVMLE